MFHCHFSLILESLVFVLTEMSPNRTVKENLVRVDGSFSGYKMQDANEFLTRILDTIKDEIDHCHMTTPSPDRSLSSKDEDPDEIFCNSSRCQKRNSSAGDVFENEMSNNTKTKSSPNNRNVSDVSQQDCDLGVSSSSEWLLSGDGSESQRLTPQSNTPSKGCDEETFPRNPVKDNFEFQLFESYRCLG